MIFYQALSTNLREAIQQISSKKSIPEGLKTVECEHGMGGINSPIHYIPEQDAEHDALEKNKMTTHFKLTLPNTWN